MGSMRTRREFVILAGATMTQFALPAVARGQSEDKTGKQEEVSPAEDLMREHGVLRRILFIYDDYRSRISSKRPLDAEVLARAAGLIRRFVEDYHEKLEEQYVFPRFQKGGDLAGLVATLKQQHEAGRQVTARILEAAKTPALEKPGTQAELMQRLGAFTRMYRPHAAREDTVLFPAFHELLPRREYDELGDRFEARENELFGKEGFDKIVGEVAELERRLGLENLADFTPASR